MDEELANLIVKLSGDYEDYKNALEDAEGLTKDEVRAMRKTLEGLGDEIKELNKVAKDGEAVTRSVENAAEKYGNEIDHLNDLLNKGAISQETYTRAMNKATKEFTESDVGLRKLGNQLTSIGTTLSVGVTAPLSAFAAMAVSEFSNAENAAMRLEASIKANGGNAQALLKDYKAFADQIQSVTKFEDDHILSLIQEAESYGQTGDAAKKAVKEAIGLASVHKVSVETALRMTSALAEGRAEMLQRYIPALKGIKDPAEKAARAHEELAKFFKNAEADAKTLSGQLEIVKRDFGNALEPIGEVISKGLVPLINKTKEMVQWFGSLDASTQKTIVQIGAIAAAVGPLVLILGQASTQVVTLTTAILGLSKAQIALAGTIGVYAAIAVAMVYAADAIGVFGQKAEDLDKVQAAVNQKNKEGIDIADELAAKNLKEADTIDAKRAEVQRLEEMQARLDKSATDAQKRAQKAESNVGGGIAGFFGLDFDKKNEAEFQKKQAEDAAKLADANQRNLDIAREAVALQEGGAEQKGPSDKDIKSFEKFNQHLEAQIQEFGKISQSARLAEYATKGFSQAEIEAAEAKVNKLESLKENAKEEKKAISDANSLESSIHSLSESLKIQIEGFDESTGKMSAHELAVSKAQSKLDALMQTVEGGSEAYETLDKAQGELTKAMGDAKALAALEKNQKLLKKGEEFTKKHGEAQDKFNEKKKDLDELLEGNAISIETYNKALREAAELANKEYNAKFKVETHGIEALKSGSAEAEAHIQAFLQNKQGLTLDMKPPSTPKANKLTNADGEMKVDMATTNDLLGAIKTYIVDRSITLLSIENAGLL